MDQKLENKILAEVPAEDSTSREEKMILYNEIIKLKPKHIIETGTHRGLTTLYMATAVLENKKGFINTADPFEWGQSGNFRKFPEHEKVIEYHQIPGKDMIPMMEKIDFAFIDGFHEKDVVLEEIKALLPQLAPGAVVYFHDTNGSNPYCDVPGAIDEAGLKVEYLKTQNGMAKYVHKDQRSDSKHSAKRTGASKGKSTRADV